MCQTNLLQLYVDETLIPKLGPWSRFSDWDIPCFIMFLLSRIKANSVNYYEIY